MADANKPAAPVELAAQLAEDCVVLGQLDFCRLLLMDNAALPWFVLVPDTRLTEICELSAEDQLRLWAEVNTVANFVRANFQVDKLNIGAIGNVVSQLHVHVVGRRQDDYCWPGVVWGAARQEPYSAQALAVIKETVNSKLNLRTQ